MTRCNITKLLLIFICLLICFRGNAIAKQTIKTDTAFLQKIEVSKKVLDNYRNNQHFSYGKATVDPGLLKRLLLDLLNWRGMRFISGIAPLLFYSLLMLAFVVLIVLLFRSKFQGVFLANKNESGFSLGNSEISDQIDLDGLLEDAIKEKNFNLAIRYFYLILLRLLNQKNIIAYKMEKTNFEYLSEISNKEILPQFRNATRNYEYAWYGHFPLDESSYNDISTDFKSLIEKLNA